MENARRFPFAKWLLMSGQTDMLRQSRSLVKQAGLAAVQRVRQAGLDARPRRLHPPRDPEGGVGALFLPIQMGRWRR